MVLSLVNYKLTSNLITQTVTKKTNPVANVELPLRVSFNTSGVNAQFIFNHLPFYPSLAWIGNFVQKLLF